MKGKKLRQPRPYSTFSSIPQSARRKILHAARAILRPFDSCDLKLVDRLSYPHDVPLNKVCGIAETENPQWRNALRDLDLHRRNAPFHRKAWEFAHALYGLRKLNRLPPNAVALGVASGHERILYFLANKIRTVVATDLYRGSFAGKEASPYMLHYPDMFAPFHFRKDRLQILVMDATKLDFPASSFDFVFSFSSIEHFGSRNNALTALNEMFRVLKPGGIAVITTELILNRLGKAPAFFRRAEIKPVFLDSAGFALVQPQIDYRIQSRFLRDPVDFPFQAAGKPCVVLRKGLTLFTSIILFLQKPPSASSRQPTAAIGDEKPHQLKPYRHRADITSPLTRFSVKRGELIRVPLKLRNLGDVVWYNHPAETHTVKIGAHLLTPTGQCIIWDFARQNLPSSVKPGHEARVDLLSTAPRRSGHFLLEIDMVKEGILWFAEHGSPTLTIPLNVESR